MGEQLQQQLKGSLQIKDRLISPILVQSDIPFCRALPENLVVLSCIKYEAFAMKNFPTEVLNGQSRLCWTTLVQNSSSDTRLQLCVLSACQDHKETHATLVCLIKQMHASSNVLVVKVADSSILFLFPPYDQFKQSVNGTCPDWRVGVMIGVIAWKEKDYLSSLSGLSVLTSKSTFHGNTSPTRPASSHEEPALPCAVSFRVNKDIPCLESQRKAKILPSQPLATNINSPADMGTLQNNAPPQPQPVPAALPLNDMSLSFANEEAVKVKTEKTPLTESNFFSENKELRDNSKLRINIIKSEKNVRRVSVVDKMQASIESPSVMRSSVLGDNFLERPASRESVDSDESSRLKLFPDAKATLKAMFSDIPRIQRLRKPSQEAGLSRERVCSESSKKRQSPGLSEPGPAGPADSLSDKTQPAIPDPAQLNQPVPGERCFAKSDSTLEILESLSSTKKSNSVQDKQMDEPSSMTILAKGITRSTQFTEKPEHCEHMASTPSYNAEKLLVESPIDNVVQHDSWLSCKENKTEKMKALARGGKPLMVKNKCDHGHPALRTPDSILDTTSTSSSTGNSSNVSTGGSGEPKVKRPRGRPRKYPPTEASPKNNRGRSQKKEAIEFQVTAINKNAPNKKPVHEGSCNEKTADSTQQTTTTKKKKKKKKKDENREESKKNRKRKLGIESVGEEQVSKFSGTLNKTDASGLLSKSLANQKKADKSRSEKNLKNSTGKTPGKGSYDMMRRSSLVPPLKSATGHSNWVTPTTYSSKEETVSSSESACSVKPPTPVTPQSASTVQPTNPFKWVIPKLRAATENTHQVAKSGIESPKDSKVESPLVLELKSPNEMQLQTQKDIAVLKTTGADTMPSPLLGEHKSDTMPLPLAGPKSDTMPSSLAEPKSDTMPSPLAGPKSDTMPSFLAEPKSAGETPMKNKPQKTNSSSASKAEKKKYKKYNVGVNAVVQISSACSQTEIIQMSSSICQTAIKTYTNSDCQTVRGVYTSDVCRTEVGDVSSSLCQTDMPELSSREVQTEANTHTSSTMTDPVSETNSALNLHSHVFVNLMQTVISALNTANPQVVQQVQSSLGEMCSFLQQQLSGMMPNVVSLLGESNKVLITAQNAAMVKQSLVTASSVESEKKQRSPEIVQITRQTPDSLASKTRDQPEVVDLTLVKAELEETSSAPAIFSSPKKIEPLSNFSSSAEPQVGLDALPHVSCDDHLGHTEIFAETPYSQPCLQNMHGEGLLDNIVKLKDTGLSQTSEAAETIQNRETAYPARRVSPTPLINQQVKQLTAHDKVVELSSDSDCQVVNESRESLSQFLWSSHLPFKEDIIPGLDLCPPAQNNDKQVVKVVKDMPAPTEDISHPIEHEEHLNTKEKVSRVTKTDNVKNDLRQSKKYSWNKSFYKLRKPSPAWSCQSRLNQPNKALSPCKRRRSKSRSRSRDSSRSTSSAGSRYCRRYRSRSSSTGRFRRSRSSSKPRFRNSRGFRKARRHRSDSCTSTASSYHERQRESGSRERYNRSSPTSARSRRHRSDSCTSTASSYHERQRESGSRERYNRSSPTSSRSRRHRSDSCTSTASSYHERQRESGSRERYKRSSPTFCRSSKSRSRSRSPKRAGSKSAFSSKSRHTFNTTDQPHTKKLKTCTYVAEPHSNLFRKAMGLPKKTSGFRNLKNSIRDGQKCTTVVKSSSRDGKLIMSSSVKGTPDGIIQNSTMPIGTVLEGIHMINKPLTVSIADNVSYLQKIWTFIHKYHFVNNETQEHLKAHVVSYSCEVFTVRKSLLLHTMCLPIRNAVHDSYLKLIRSFVPVCTVLIMMRYDMHYERANIKNDVQKLEEAREHYYDIEKRLKLILIWCKETPEQYLLQKLLNQVIDKVDILAKGAAHLLKRPRWRRSPYEAMMEPGKEADVAPLERASLELLAYQYKFKPIGQNEPCEQQNCQNATDAVEYEAVKSAEKHNPFLPSHSPKKSFKPVQDNVPQEQPKEAPVKTHKPKQAFWIQKRIPAKTSLKTGVVPMEAKSSEELSDALDYGKDATKPPRPCSASRKPLWLPGASSKDVPGSSSDDDDDTDDGIP